jgi:transcriptional regulator with XRE-family HTH domain
MTDPEDRRYMVGERLAELREQKALTLHDLEELSGVGADGISKIENGHRKPRPSTLRKLARALGVEVEDFFREPAVPLDEAPRDAGLAGKKGSIFDVAHEATYAQLRKDAQMFRRAEQSGQPQRHTSNFDVELANFLLDHSLEEVAWAYAMLMYNYVSLEGKVEELEARLQERERAHS